jgi:hypothetical protein
MQMVMYHPPDGIDAVFADMNIPQHPGAALLMRDWTTDCNRD